MAPLDTLLYSDDCVGDVVISSIDEDDIHHQFIVNSVVNGGRRSSTVCTSPRKTNPRPTTTTTTAKNVPLSTSRKTVSFAPTVYVRQVLHINNYLEQEVQDSWYTKEEYSRIKKEISLTVYMMDREELQDQPKKNKNDDWYCGRGLETRTKTGTVRKHQNREQARFVVFDMQHMYSRLGSEEHRARAVADLGLNHGGNNNNIMFDDEIYTYFNDVDITAMAIAEIYHEITNPSALHARQVGMQDAMEAATTR